MGLWDKVGGEDAAQIVARKEQLKKKKEKVAKKIGQHYSPSGQRHDFDRAVHNK